MEREIKIKLGTGGLLAVVGGLLLLGMILGAALTAATNKPQPIVIERGSFA